MSEKPKTRREALLGALGLGAAAAGCGRTSLDPHSAVNGGDLFDVIELTEQPISPVDDGVAGLWSHAESGATPSWPRWTSMVPDRPDIPFPAVQFPIGAEQAADVRRFGARGDGATDDRAA